MVNFGFPSQKVSDAENIYMSSYIHATSQVMIPEWKLNKLDRSDDAIV